MYTYTVKHNLFPHLSSPSLSFLSPSHYLLILFPFTVISLTTLSFQVNGQNVRHSTHQQVVQWLVSQKGNIELLVEHVPQPAGLQVHTYMYCTLVYICRPILHVHVHVYDRFLYCRLDSLCTVSYSTWTCTIKLTTSAVVFHSVLPLLYACTCVLPRQSTVSSVLCTCTCT